MKERKEIFVKYLFALSCGWDAVEIVWFKFLQGELKFAKHIEKFAHENSKKYDVTVATSDGLEQIIIRGQGCFLLSARDLLEEVERARMKNREEYMDVKKDKDSKTYLLDGFKPEEKM